MIGFKRSPPLNIMNPHHVKFHTHTRAFSEDLALEFSHPYVIILHTTLINLIRQILLFYENQREEKVEGENQQPTTTTTFQGGKHTPPESKEKKNFSEFISSVVRCS